MRDPSPEARCDAWTSKPRDRVRAADAGVLDLHRGLPRSPGRGAGAARPAAYGPALPDLPHDRRHLRGDRDQLGQRRPGDRGGGLAGDRRADLLHVDDRARLRSGVDPAVRRALHRERQPVRPPGRGRAGYAGRAGGDRAQGRAHRGLPAGVVRAVRDDAVPGIERPDHHVRGPGDLVAAALSALRPGASAAAAVAGVGAEVLPAGCALLGVLPLRSRAAVRLRRFVHPRRHR